ncbi:hypothetical protein J2Z40_002881 [Cytobacillus eiseniae]|uniref:Lipoprotein n=1 Tax=Cytobacillus eiseniae TaxID=762947 RepID=A0ABS4RHB9_9BACI|nr:hypothetical protein [Cytobacillus eiseniae]MBP2242307.1 hypothetical protein [Cytobacillus eiseniae]
MNKLLLSLLILLLLVGCQENKSGKLDTSKLNIIDTAYNEQGEVSFAVYEATSIKNSLKALPFKMKLPLRLPFESTEFQPARIIDMNNDGKTLVTTFDIHSKNQEELIILKIEAYFPSDITREPENAHYHEVELKNGIVGRKYATSIFFQVNDANFNIFYLNTQISSEQSDKELIEMANQMF